MTKTLPAESEIGQRLVVDAVAPTSADRRILILAPTGNDARLTAGFLTEAGLCAEICGELVSLSAEVRVGCAAIVLAEETLAAGSISLLVEALAQQPAWSNVPVAIITSSGEASQLQLHRLAIFGPGANVTLLERPFRPSTLVSTLLAALRARERQYQVRDLVQAMEELMRQQEAQARLFDATLSSIADLAYTFDVEGNWTYANKALLQLWGKSLQEIKGKSSLELGYPAELAERLRRQVKEVVRTRQPFRGETYFTDVAGNEDYHEYIFSPVLAADGSVTSVCGTTRLTTERKRAEAIAESHRRVLQLIAEDMPLGQILEALMRTVELEYSKKSLASVMLVDPDGLHLRFEAAPGLPPALRAALDGVAIGPRSGSCALAAFTKKSVYVSDIATDPLWASFRDVTLDGGLRACWSIPIFSTGDKVLGTFAIYHREQRRANYKDWRVVELATRTAAIAIERKLSDAALRESRERYRQLVHGLPTAVYTTDAQGQVLLYNEAAARLWGRTPEVGKDLWCGSYRIYRPDGTPLPLDQCPLAITLREGRPVRGQEIVIERPDGTRRLVLPYPDPIRDVAGQIVGAVNMLLDITETKRAEEASWRLAAIVESSDDAIISKDLNGVITTWNRGAVRLFGYQAQEIVGQPVTVLMPPDRVNEEPGILERIRRGERIEHYETVRQRKDGSLMDVSLAVSPLRDASGKVIGASKIVRDITERKRAERNLARAHQEAVAASRAKDDFLAALSHELRTPLNPVLLIASEASEDSQISAELRARFITIRNNVELEARLIDDLLDITRITHDKISMSLGLVDVHSVLAEAIATVRPELAAKRLALASDLAAKPATVNGDAVRLQQVFWNVLKNAVKFTPAGGNITVTTRTRADAKLIVTITDTGIGMTSRDLGQIFEAFSQGERLGAGSSHLFGGLGLGLAISRKLVELHHGTIQAASEGPNKGATFIVTLPLNTKAAPMHPLPPEIVSGARAAVTSGSSPIHILLVEDHEPTRTVLAHLLTHRRYDVKTAASLAEARALSEQHVFQVLISDIGLPDGNGFDLMIELSTRHRELQGIALTGYGMEQDQAKALQAGFRLHLTKPVRLQSLELALAEVTAPLLTRLAPSGDAVTEPSAT